MPLTPRNPEFLSALPSPDRGRFRSTLGTLSESAAEPILIVGSIALRYHLLLLELPPLHRILHDLDLAVSDVDSLPSVEGETLLVSHYHPESAFSGTGRMLLQLVDVRSKLRIDIFQALAGALDRASPLGDTSSVIFVASVEDMLVRSLLVFRAQVQSGMAMAKHVETIRRLTDFVDRNKADQLWTSVRHGDHSESIQAAIAHTEGLRQDQPSSDTVQAYGTLDDPPCDLCVCADRYPLADKRRIYDILGYI